jgi:hypothetical protein
LSQFNPTGVASSGTSSENCVPREFGECVRSRMIAGFANLFGSSHLRLGWPKVAGSGLGGHFL